MAHDVGGKRVTVIGAAKSGIAAAALLADKGAIVTLTDVRTRVPEADVLRARNVTVELGGHDTATLTSADLIVVSPGVPPEQPAVAAARNRGIPVVSEIEVASWWLQGRIVAITGTKGKSTTTALIGRMLTAAGFRVTVGGNIGDPVSAQAVDSTPEMLHVVETSSFQLEQIDTFRPWIAVLLNFSPDHLDRHPDLDAYGRAKARIFENQRPEDWAVINADDPATLNLARNARASKRYFAREARLEEGVVTDEGWIVAKRVEGAERLIPLEAIRLIGPHLVDDVLAAAAVGRIAGATPTAMTAAVRDFRGLEHAMELVGRAGHVRFVNDSKATNVVSALRSIESFDEGVVAIIGGRFKGGDLTLLREALRRRARAVVAIGEARPLVRQAFAGVVDVYAADSFDAAVEQAFTLALPDGVVLLAPACASFDMFESYAERGRRFKEQVARIAARVSSEGTDAKT